MSALLEIDDLHHAYGERPVVRGLTLSLQRGSVACLLGASGCGKTTVLRCIAGLEAVTAGVIRLSGNVVSRPGQTVPPEQRRVGMVFQDYALFPHLTIAENVGFGLRRQSSKDRARRVGELLEMVGLAHVETVYPHQLSGGQQQRVALARALAPAPDLLLLDEPFSNLDVELRARLSQEVRSLLKRQNITAVLVTHDQNEAFAVADEVGIMNAGRVEQWDAPYNLYHRPANRFVADFIGQGVFVPGRVLSPREVEIELGMLRGEIPHECAEAYNCAACGKNCFVDVLLRPDDLVHDDLSPMKAEVTQKAFRGADILYTLRLASGAEVLSLVPSHHNHRIGEKIGIRLEADHVVAFRHDRTA